MNHYYGNNGRDERKVDTKSLIFDFEFFKALTDSTFVTHLKEKLNTFVTTLKEGKKTEKLQASSLFDIKTFQVANINTTDSTIGITLFLEHYFASELGFEKYSKPTKPISAADVAMVIKYVFKQDNIEMDHSSKKRKISDNKLKSIIDYSQIKLPAQMLLHYLENYGSLFLNECIR